MSSPSEAMAGHPTHSGSLCVHLEVGFCLKMSQNVDTKWKHSFVEQRGQGQLIWPPFLPPSAPPLFPTPSFKEM